MSYLFDAGRQLILDAWMRGQIAELAHDADDEWYLNDAMGLMIE